MKHMHNYDMGIYQIFQKVHENVYYEKNKWISFFFFFWHQNKHLLILLFMNFLKYLHTYFRGRGLQRQLHQVPAYSTPASNSENLKAFSKYPILFLWLPNLHLLCFHNITTIEDAGKQGPLGAANISKVPNP